MSTMMAARRREIISRVLTALQGYDEPNNATSVTDVLTDLRHLCEAHGWDFDALDRMAYQHYLAEKAGEQ